MGEVIKKNKTTAYYIYTVIGIAIMLFFQYLPAPDPITKAGMAVLGQFIGLIILWTLVDLVWPTFLAIVLFGFNALAVYPKSTQLAGIYEAGAQSFGNWIVVFVIATLILAVALQEVGTIRRITMWFLTRKFAKKSAWTFTFMFLLASMVVGLFLDVTAAQFFLLFIAHEVFEELGYNKGEHWPQIVTVGISFTVILGFAMTPICHTLPILFMGILSSITQQPINMLSYMLVGVPIGFVIWFIMFFWFRYIVKPDVSRFEHFNFDQLEKKRPGPMDAKEKFVVIVCIIVAISWILPGFLSFLAPKSALFGWLKMITQTGPILLAIVVLSIIRIKGKPALDLPAAFSQIAWVPIVLLAGIMLIAGAMGEQSTGIPGYIAKNIVPLASGMSPFMVVAAIGVLSCILTNVANNVPVGILFISAGAPMALSMGIKPAVIGMAVCLGANLAYAIPPAFVPVGVCYADPYGGPGVTLRNGIFMCIVSCIVLALLVYPLSEFFF